MIRNFYLALTLAFLFACDTASNIKPPGNNYFIKYYGGDGNQTAVDLIVNTDGTFFILGNSRQEQDSIQKIYLAKVNAQGDVIWQVTHGNSETEAKDFLLTPDGQNLVVVANTNLTSGSPNVSIMFFNTSNGATGSSTTIAGSNNYSNSITQLADQGFMVSGYTVSADTSGWVYRVDQTLAPAAGWFTSVGGFHPGTTNEIVQAFESASTGFFYFFGYTNAQYQNTFFKGFWAFELGTSGGSKNNNDDSLKGFASTNINQYLTHVTSSLYGSLVTGVTTDATNNVTIKAIQIASVQLQFSNNDIVGKYQSPSLGKPTATSPPFATSCYSIGGIKPGFLILANRYLSTTGLAIPSDITLYKVGVPADKSGNLSSVWSQTVQFGGDGEDTAAAVAELPDGHIMLLGTMQLGNPPEQFKIVMMKLNASGALGE